MTNEMLSDQIVIFSVLIIGFVTRRIFREDLFAQAVFKEAE